jgi:hypothetical protein
MEQVITVKNVVAPAPGKKQAAIYDTSDQRWGIHPNEMNAFVPGSSYKVWNWKSSTFNGREYRTIESGNYQFVGGNAVPPNAGNLNSATSAAPSQRSAGGFDDATRRRDIFVCGALNNLLGNTQECARFFREDGTLDGSLLTATVWKLRKVFDYSLGPNAQDPAISSAPRPNHSTPEGQAQNSQGYGRVADMNDEIPF